MSNLLIKSATAIALSSILAACGGGGGGSSTGTQTTPPNGNNGTTTTTLGFTLSQQSVSMDELTEKSVNASVNYNGANSLTYSYSFSNQTAQGYSSISESNNVFTIAAREVEQDVSFTVDITLSDGTLSETKTLTVSIDNVEDEVTPDPDTISVTAMPTSIDLQSGSSETIDLDLAYTGSGQVTYSVSYDDQIGMTHEIVDNQVTFTAPMVEDSVELIATIVATDGVISDSATVMVKIVENADLMAEAEAWANSNPYSMNELDNLLRYYVNAAYFAGGIKNSEKETWVQNYVSLQEQIALKNEGEEIVQFRLDLEDLKNGWMTQSDFQGKFTAFKAHVNSQSNQLISMLNDLSDLSDGALPSLDADRYAYSEEYTVFSSIIGNASTGSLQEGTWVLNSEHEFMGTMISSLGITSQCESN